MLQRRSCAPQRAISPLVGASAVLHVAALAAVVGRARLWPWALAAVVLDHGLLIGAGLWPRSRLLGPNWVRLPQASAARGEVAVTIDDGPDPEITPQVLEQLARFEASATFFCVGERVERHPELARAILAGGHRIENHTQRHRHSFSLLGPRGLRAEIEGAQQSIARVTGSSALFFRAPAGLRNPFLEPVLRSLGLQLTSWTRRGFDTVNRDPAAVLRRLTRSLCAGDILLLHDGHAARTAGGAPVILETLPRLLETLRAARLRPVTLRAALA
ncbi:MAG TPA: polysaccharide deacetylase family protein [Steroidobacteraceae bacterium]|nr:polysaccharide deacetylase family protein [Steroidobacteraceae bacterium]